MSTTTTLALIGIAGVGVYFYLQANGKNTPGKGKCPPAANCKQYWEGKPVAGIVTLQSGLLAKQGIIVPSQFDLVVSSKFTTQGCNCVFSPVNQSPKIVAPIPQ